MTSRLRCVPLLLALSALPAVAAAQSTSSVAETLFDEGRALFEAGRFEEACPKFRESDRIEPAVGSKLNLALCEERMGRIATAWALFRVVAEKLPPADTRLAIAEERREALSSRVPYVTLRLKPGSPPDTTVALGQLLLSAASFGTPLAIDPGEHTLTVRAGGHADATASFAAVEGKTIDLEVVPGPSLAPPDVPPPSAPRALVVVEKPAAPAARETFTPLRFGAVGAGAAGVLSLVVSGIFAASAVSHDQQSTDLGCQGNLCPSDAKQARLDALAMADRATVFAITGTVLVAGGAVLWFAGSPNAVGAAASFDGASAHARVRATFH